MGLTAIAYGLNDSEIESFLVPCSVRPYRAETGDRRCSSSLSKHCWNISREIFLADPALHKSERVDNLIGAELFADLLEQGQIKLAPHLPSLLKTKFGWIVSGSMYDES
uniref:Peptidase aspartic putative domain-containing protein n=1 Tax=Anopheles dirus TaxID=7168 RepID=A0A182NCK6_9DIPT